MFELIVILVSIYCQIRILKLDARTRLFRGCSGGPLHPAGYDRIFRAIVLFPPAWDAVILTMDVGFICPFVVTDPTI